MARPLARLKLPQSVKDKISNSKKGRPRSEDTKEKIRASRIGKKHSPETIAKIAAARQRRAAMTDAELAEECRRRNVREQREQCNLRVDRWKLDQLTCIRLGLTDLFADVKQSFGWQTKRKMKGADKRVSDGYCHREGKILWPAQ